MYFKGFHRVEEQWNEDARETRCSEVYEQLVEDTMENLQGMLIQWPPEFHAFFLRNAMRELKQNERMFVSLKQSGYASEDIDYLFNETDFYFTNTFGTYIHATPFPEKAPYNPVVYKAMRFKKNNVR